MTTAGGAGRLACVLPMFVALAGVASATPPVEEDYVLHCSACHGPDGSGAKEVVPGLEGVGEIALLPGGRDYLMRVPGAAQSPLDDARLARLLNWVVAEFGGVTLTPALTVSEVGAARKAPLRDPARVRDALTGAASAQ